MNKKLLPLLLGIIMMMSSCVSKTEMALADLVGNLLMLHSTTVYAMSSYAQYGMPFPQEGVEVEVNEEQTERTATYDGIIVSDLLALFGASEEDIAKIPMESFSGTLTENVNGTVVGDFQVEGAPASTISFTMDGETQEMMNVIADEKPYDLNKAIAKIIEKQEAEMKEQQNDAEEAQAAAAVEQSQLGPELPPAQAPAPEANLEANPEADPEANLEANPAQ